MAATTANTVSTHHWASSALQIARHSSALLSIGTGSRFRTRPGNANGHPSALASALASIGALASIEDWHQHKDWRPSALASVLESTGIGIGTGIGTDIHRHTLLHIHRHSTLASIDRHWVGYWHPSHWHIHRHWHRHWHGHRHLGIGIGKHWHQPRRPGIARLAPLLSLLEARWHTKPVPLTHNRGGQFCN